MVWRLVGARDSVKFASDEAAKDWLDWGLKYASDASATEWANVAGGMRRSRRFAQAQKALDQAVATGVSSRTWYECAALLAETKGDLVKAGRWPIQKPSSSILPMLGCGTGWGSYCMKN